MSLNRGAGILQQVRKRDGEQKAVTTLHEKLLNSDCMRPVTCETAKEHRYNIETDIDIETSQRLRERPIPKSQVTLMWGNK